MLNGIFWDNRSGEAGLCDLFVAMETGDSAGDLVQEIFSKPGIK